MALKQTPLNWAIPIVDDQGRPTPEFMSKWEAQTRINGAIPELSTATQVSAVLDKIGGTAGDMLRRGATVWGVIATTTGTDKFLRADGTWAELPQQTVDESEIDLSDVLTNNVSTTRHGFTPKLSGTATEYLDGSGQWSTPAGGGGGGGTWAAPTSGNSMSSSANASKGCAYTPLAGITVNKLWVRFSPEPGSVYKIAIFEFSESTLGIKVAGDVALPWVSTGVQDVIVDLSSPASLDKGTRYAFLVTRTDGSGSTAALLQVDEGSLPAPVMLNGYVTLADTAPSTGDAPLLTAGDYADVGMQFS